MISKSLKKTLLEMSPGFVLYEIVLFIVLCILAYYKVGLLSELLLGYAAGIALSIYIILDMAFTIEEVIDSGDPDYARRKTMLHAGIRKFVLIGVIISALYLKFVNPVVIVFALFGIKIAAYMQPYTHRFLRKDSYNDKV